MSQAVYHTANNSLLADQGAALSFSCNGPLTFAQWQALGQDAGSVAGVTPGVPELIALGAAVLGINPIE